MRSLRVLLAALLVVVLGACQSLTEITRGSKGTRLTRILENRELRVGLTASQPPLNMRDKRGQIVGLEVDLVRALAMSMDLEARLVTLPFAELLPALERGEVDMVVSGLTITPERNARVAFAGPYFISGKSVLTKSDRISSVEDLAELDDTARSYAALAGSTSEKLVQKLMPRATLVATAGYDEAVRMVIDGQVDALVADYPICMLSVLRHPGAGLSALMTPFTVEPLGIALPADDPLLVNLVQNYLNTLEGTGLLPRLKARWFSEGAWLSELP